MSDEVNTGIAEVTGELILVNELHRLKFCKDILELWTKKLVLFLRANGYLNVADLKIFSLLNFSFSSQSRSSSFLVLKTMDGLTKEMVLSLQSPSIFFPYDSSDHSLLQCTLQH